MNTEIKLYATSINNFRINRVIRTVEAAERAVNDLRAKLAETAAVNKEPTDICYAVDLIRLKISYRVGNSPFLATKVYWLGNKVACAKAVSNLQEELQRLLAESCDVKRSSLDLADSQTNCISGRDWSALEWEVSEIRCEVDEIDNLSGLLHQYLLRQLEWNNHDAKTQAMFSHIFDVNDMIVRRSSRVMESLKVLDTWPKANAAAA